MTSNIPADEEPLDYLREIIMEQDSILTDPHPHEVTKEELAKGVFDQLDPEDWPVILQAILDYWCAEEVMRFLAVSVEAKYNSLHKNCCVEAETLDALDFDPEVPTEHPHDPFHHNPGSG
jgi:hypothetical protein